MCAVKRTFSVLTASKSSPPTTVQHTTHGDGNEAGQNACNNEKRGMLGPIMIASRG